MRSLKMLSIPLVVFLTLGLGLAACGNDKGGSEGATETSQATTGAGDEGTVVDVKLGESSPSKYFVKVDKDEVKAGKVTFEVKNVGKMEHELHVYQSDSDPGDLPIDKEKNQAKLDPDHSLGEAEVSDGHGDEKEGEEHEHDLIAPGETGKLTVDMSEGKYVLLCNLPGHYSKKQYTGFTVE